MIEFISKEFSEITYKACQRLSDKYGVEKNRVQLLLSLNPDGDNAYHSMVDYAKRDELKFKQDILNVKFFHVKGYDMIAPPFINKALVGFCEKYEIEAKDISVVIIPKEENKVALFLYNGGKAVKKIEWDEIFSGENMPTPQDG